MNRNLMPLITCLLAVSSITVATVSAAPKAPAQTNLTDAGNKLLPKYESQFKTLQAEIERELPKIDGQSMSALDKAGEALKAAEAEAKAAQLALGKIQAAKGLVDHAKGKWIGGAEKGIAQAEAALKNASTDAEREAAKNEIAKWQANKEDGLEALKIRQEDLDKAQAEAPKLTKANQAAQAALAKAKINETTAAKAIMTKVEPYLTSDKLDAKLVKCTVLAEAAPHGLAEFAQQGEAQEAMVDKLLSNDSLMKAMLEAGGAKFGKYARAMEIHTAIGKAGSKSSEGPLQRLALAVSLEHAKPIEQTNSQQNQTGAPGAVDPVKRYMHYEKAYLAGQLDPAFKNFTTWEYRMVVGCDAPDEILAWGREMLQNYRPDHIYNPDYGWRYSAAVKTEVPYGSQNVVNDLPTLHKYQNIAMNGGVCGRRAFFGRFILQSFGIPTWGVTQKAHAALSHWTPKGWVVNLGAGFEHSWWDKDEAPRSGSDFLLETQARARGQEYLKVLRARWISRILGEVAFNDRKGVTGGFWSGMAHHQAVEMAATAAGLGPLGQELAEANEAKEKQKAPQVKVTEVDQKTVISGDGVITIPATAHGKPSGPFAAMKSFSGGMQLHVSGGFKAEYAFDAPSAGKFLLSAQVVTAQTGNKLMIAANDPNAPAEIAVPYTIGMWEHTKPLEISLVRGKNVLHIMLVDGSRGVAIKQLTLKPMGR